MTVARAWVRSRYVDRLDLSIQEIADIAGISSRTVRNWCADLPKRRRRCGRELSIDQCQEVARLYTRLSYEDVEIVTGYTDTTIKRALARVGVSPRSPGRRGTQQLAESRASSVPQSQLAEPRRSR